MKTWTAFFLMTAWAGVEGFVHWGVPVLYVGATAAIIAARLKLSPEYKAYWLSRGWPVPGFLK